MLKIHSSVADRPLTEDETRIRRTIESHVQMLAGKIGIRNQSEYRNLEAAAAYIERCLRKSGYDVERQEIHVPDENVVWNLEATLPGSGDPNETIVIGAHYDSAPGSPGANDNASGVAALLALAELHARQTRERTIRFVAFANEESPHFKTPVMGSVLYANWCKQRGDRIYGMICLETIGYYSQEPRTQTYPFPLQHIYPDTANFVALVGNLKSSKLMTELSEAFRRSADFPCLSASVPSWIPGVSASDHWAFWRNDYPAVMITDTANFRYWHFHSADDTPDKLNYPGFARVVIGISGILDHLARKADRSIDP
jgi:Zn-dependent M28 family amino/carboxypeptidase